MGGPIASFIYDEEEEHPYAESSNLATRLERIAGSVVQMNVVESVPRYSRLRYLAAVLGPVVAFVSGLLAVADQPAEQVARITRKLEVGEPLVFATFGDSITYPCYHTDYRQNYITFTVDALRKRYLKSQIEVVHAGNMGTAGRGLSDNRFEKHVLAHKPDAVFIMFGMNDCLGVLVQRLLCERM